MGFVLADNRGRELLENTIAAVGFYSELRRNGKDVAYYGNVITSKEADSVLMRWDISDSEFRVIFGDLRTENINADLLAEIE